MLLLLEEETDVALRRGEVTAEVRRLVSNTARLRGETTRRRGEDIVRRRESV